MFVSSFSLVSLLHYFSHFFAGLLHFQWPNVTLDLFNHGGIGPLQITKPGRNRAEPRVQAQSVRPDLPFLPRWCGPMQAAISGHRTSLDLI